MKKLLLLSTFLLASGAFQAQALDTASPAEDQAKLDSDPVVRDLDTELKRSLDKLKNAGKAPLYFLAYRLYEGTWDNISASDGCLDDREPRSAWRMSSVDLRVGSPHFDNSHYLRADKSSAPPAFDRSSKHDSILPTLGAGLPLRQAFWLKTSDTFKDAQTRYQALLASKDVLAEEDDKSADFSLQPKQSYHSGVTEQAVDRPAWEERIRRLSRIFLEHPRIQTSEVSFDARPTTRYMVTSEGSRIVEHQPLYRVSIKASSLSDDGMNLWLWDSFASRDINKLPDESVLLESIKRLADKVDQLREAGTAEPYVGPAILSGRAAAVFFHETFGHRIEAIHEKNESEGKTFSKKIGTQVMPSFLTVSDDPTATEAHDTELSGHYVYDDEGVRGQPVTLAKNGKLTGFLLGRMLVQGFNESNGHGRSSPGWNPMARQSNLFVHADAEGGHQVEPDVLRKMLIEEAKRQKKDYGLYFDEVSGGYTYTSRGSEQTYSILPLVVYKVYVDGRPDELIRGVDIVGTPLSALEHIVAAGTDYAVFNGVCGRESGPVPVSAVAPSLLIDSIEIKRTAKTFEKPPILPDPTRSAAPEPKETGK